MSSPTLSNIQPSTDGDFSDDVPWIGVDLDGTLARFSTWRGFGHIGKPIKSMMERVRNWQKEGYKVKIFTARASIPDAIPPVEKWLKKHKLAGLEVTNRKDFFMVELWDDRCIQVVTNSGKPIRSPSVMARPKVPLLEEAFPHENRPSLAEN
ncbi:hypothetical protein [Rubellicoccus peritrichatus]|uniref:Polynucleotide kinase n=1 Tax=Rubellicoccus peritrichatus TaxID=3080537 RepID=A0AAQ3QVI1_9BACT|nr:hypothetical protein [Puniceicoccus sp. CR14]WOO40920.1 hypothetical protein RZN69_20045 [Puniceicoccus sp. CR14]